MFEQFLIHVASDIVLAFCAGLMVALFVTDLYGLLRRMFVNPASRHFDFRSPIVSIGIFGTFLGILSGLYGFDSNNINRSVPMLLEGLKFAFATSVFGMFLSLILSVLGKFCGTSGEDTEILISIDGKMGSMEKNMSGLVATLESPTELVKQFSEMKVFLKDELKQINVSLDQALMELAKGASSEVIQALERIIVEFNTNLQEQFGENFKELNAACLKLLEWQRNYRLHVEASEKHLSGIIGILDKASAAAAELVSSHEETRDICREVGGLIKTYDVQVRTLATHLESCKELGEEAKVFLSNTQDALVMSSKNMNDFSGVIQQSVSVQSEALTQLTKEIESQLPEALGQLEDVLTDLTNQFAGDYKSLFEFVANKR